MPRTASCRLTWPAMTLSQVGELASSKSAMKTWAPELRALIIILRSTGPVISTRRSTQGLGCLGTVQSPVRTSAVSAEEVRALAGVEAGLALGPRRQQVPPAGVEAVVQIGHELGRPRASGPGRRPGAA